MYQHYKSSRSYSGDMASLYGRLLQESYFVCEMSHDGSELDLVWVLPCVEFSV